MFIEFEDCFLNKSRIIGVQCNNILYSIKFFFEGNIERVFSYNEEDQFYEAIILLREKLLGV